MKMKGDNMLCNNKGNLTIKSALKNYLMLFINDG